MTFLMSVSWSGIGMLLAIAAISLSLRAPLRLSLLVAFVVGFMAVIAAFQYKDDGTNPWYVEFSFSVLLAVVLTAVVLLVAAGWRSARHG
jgi:hypothetical protein